MGQTIQISEKSAALLAQQAAEQGVTVEAWIEKLALGAQVTGQPAQGSTSSEDGLIEYMHDLRSRVKLDPEGWTVRDYIECGRR